MEWADLENEEKSAITRAIRKKKANIGLTEYEQVCYELWLDLYADIFYDDGQR